MCLGPCQTSMMVLFCGYSEQRLAFDSICKNSLSSVFHRVLNTPRTSVSSEHILVFWEFSWKFMVVFCITGHKMHKVRTELYVEIHFVLNYRIVKMISDCQSTYRFLILGMIMWWSHLKSLWQSNWLLVIFISVVFVWSLVHQVTIVTQLFE